MNGQAMEFDHVIVGAGSAGCVLASRLTEDPSVTVCLVEAGPRDGSLSVRMPAALTFALESDDYNWKFESEPEPELGGRIIGQARGRGLGGSSSINGMVFVRGPAQDYDSWRELGVAGWDFFDCLPFFRRMESFEGGQDPLRGANGPLSVVRSHADHPLYRAFLNAGRQYGLADAGDYNSGSQEGVHVTQATIRDGVRCSTSLAYLAPARARPNLTILTGARAERIHFAGRQARGVTVVQRGRRRRLDAGREVILSAGSLGTPHLLLLSGVGGKAQLECHGIAVVADLPGVGEDLQDHVVVPLRYATGRGVSLRSRLEGPSRLALGLEWLLFKSGLGASNFFEVGAFFSAGAAAPCALQHEFLPFLADFQSGKVRLGDGYQYFVSQMRPRSRGSVRLNSGDPACYPAIRFNYLSDRADLEEMIGGVRATMEMAAQTAWDPFRIEAIDPVGLDTPDADLGAWIRTVANTEHHPTSSCRMGEDAHAVTDAAGRVHGLEGLRIVDGSILPRIPAANVNAPIIMAAEKIADAIRP